MFDDALRQQKLIAAFEEHTSAGHLAFSPDGKWIAAALENVQPAVKVWPATGGGDAVTLDTNKPSLTARRAPLALAHPSPSTTERAHMHERSRGAVDSGSRST